MKIALLTLTRDRLAYTQHCFNSIQQHARVDYDHWVLDQGSEDGTVDWLRDHTNCRLIESPTNLGICKGLNLMLDTLDPAEYDVLVRFDNDCEVLQPYTLSTCAGLALDHGVICSPHVLGLNAPPKTFDPVQVGDHIIDQTAVLGGIFMAMPAWLFSEDGYRYDESRHPHSGDELIVPWHRARGGTAGYVRGFHVNHYETSKGQAATHPDYWARKTLEMAA